VAAEAHRVLAFGVAAAREKLATPAMLDDHWFAALVALHPRVLDADRDDLVLDVAREVLRGLALGVIGASKEFATLAEADDHVRAAVRAGNACFLRLDDLDLAVLALEVA